MKKKAKMMAFLAVLFLVLGTFSFSTALSFSIVDGIDEASKQNESPYVEKPELQYTLYEDDFQSTYGSRDDSPFYKLRSTDWDYYDGYWNGYVEGVTVHHTGGSFAPRDGETAAHSSHEWHRDNNGWPGIAYHFVIGEDGDIYHGSPVDSIGFHAGDERNRIDIGIKFDGGFNSNSGAYEPTQEQYEAGGHLIAYLEYADSIMDDRSGSVDLGIDGFEDVTPHTGWYEEGCPGLYFDPDELEYYYEQYSDGTAEGEWHWMYDAEHRPGIEYAYGGEEDVWEGAMRIDVPPGEMTDIAFYAHSTPEYVKGYVYTDTPGEEEPGTLIAETETVTEPGFTEWVEISLTDPVTTEGGHHWVVLEVEDTGNWPFGYIQPHVEDAGWINLNGDWQPLPDIGEDFSWALEVRVEGYTAVEDWYDLDDIRNGLDEDYYLANDLDSGTAGYDELVATANGWDPIGHWTEDGSGEFTGTLDGQGNLIKDLQIDRDDEAVVGLFERIGEGAEITDLGLEGVDITANDHVGGLVGVAYGGEISSSYVSGAVSGEGIHEYGDNTHVGGLVGKLDAGAIIDSYSSAEVTAAGPRAGGLLGTLGEAEITNSYSYGQVDGDEEIGGLVGYGDEEDVVGSFWDVEASGISEGEDDSGCGTGLETEEMQKFVTFDDAGWDIEDVSWEETDDGFTWNIVDTSTYPFLSWEEPTEAPTEYELTIEVEGEGTTDPEPGSHLYPEGTKVTIEAIPDEGWKFDDWTIDEEDEEEEEDHVSYGFWPYWTDPAEYEPDWEELSHVAVFSMTAQSDGSLYEGNMYHYDEVKDAAEGTDTDVTLTVAQFDRDTQDEILAYHKQDLVDNIVDALDDYDADGVNMDIEHVRETNSITGESNVDLMEELHEMLYDEVKSVDEDYHISFCTAGIVEEVYRNTQLSAYTDNVFMMGYDYHWGGAPTTGPVSPFDSSEHLDVTDSMDILRNYYPDDQLVLGVPFYGYEWPAESDQPGAETEGSGDSVFMVSAKDNADQYGRNWDDDGSVPWYAYEEGGQWYQGWYDDEESLELKWEYVRDEGFAGTGFWAVGYETDETWDVLGDVFSGNDALSENEKEITVTMDSDKTVTAHFEEAEHELSIDVEGEGTTQPEPGTHTYQHGTDVSVEALPDDEWEFSHWEGDYPEGEKEEDNINIVMDEEKSLTAYFQLIGEEEVELTIEVEGEGSTSPQEGTHTYNEGELVPVEAISYEGWQFIEWSGDVSEDQREEKEITVEMDADKYITAHFEEMKEEYDLTIQAEEGGTTDPEPGVYTHEEGTEVTVEAFSEDGWYFKEWTGDHESKEKEITVTVNSNMTVTAHFDELEEDERTLTIYVKGEGTTDPNPGVHVYEEGSEVTVSAEAEAGWKFSHWEDDFPEGEQEDAVITIAMDDDYTITAHFEEEVVPPEEYELTIDGTEGGEVVEPGEDTFEYEEDTIVDLEAAADEGYEFVEWTGDNGTIDDVGSNETTITMEDDYTITAEFEEIEEEVYYTLNIEVDGFGYVSTNPGEDYYEEGTEVELTANPQSGWVFNEWSGDVPEGEEENEEITITMDGDKEITVHFLREPFFEVEIVTYDQEVTEGEVVEVEYKVTNTGDVEGTQTIEFTVEGSVKDSQEITLGADEIYEGDFTWQTEEQGEFEIEIISYDDEDVASTEQVTVSVIDEDTEDDATSFWWLIVLLLLIVGVILALLLYMNRGFEAKEEENLEEEGSLEEER